jgi:hypothetical protein
MHESKIQDDIRLALSKAGVTNFRMNTGGFMTADGRFTRSGVEGMSDVLAIIPGTGQACWLECKTEKGKPTQKQVNFISQMTAQGCRAGIVRSVSDALRLCGVED